MKIDPTTRDRLREQVEREPLPTVARRYGVAEATVVRAIAGLDLQRGTVLALTNRRVPGETVAQYLSRCLIARALELSPPETDADRLRAMSSIPIPSDLEPR